MNRAIPLAIAMALAPTGAEASRLVTSPLYAGTPPVEYACTLFYAGGASAPISVLITTLNKTGALYQNRVSVSASQRLGTYGTPCTENTGLPGSRSCLPIACIFSFSAPAADFRGSLCINTGDTSVCTEAR